MKHSRREELTTDDISNALRLRKIQVRRASTVLLLPDLFFRCAAAVWFFLVGSAHISRGAWYGRFILCGRYSCVMCDELLTQPPPKVIPGPDSAAATSNLLFVCSRAPADTTFSIHWLAVNGVQPSVPQNPSLAHQTKLDKALNDWKSQQTAASAAAAAASGRADESESGSASAASSAPALANAHANHRKTALRLPLR